MLNKKFYQITEKEFINIDQVISINLKGEDEIILDFVNNSSKSYKISNLAIHFYNFIQTRLLI